MSDCRVPMDGRRKPEIPPPPIAANNTEDVTMPILDPKEQAILDAMRSGQNVEAVIKRENAKRHLEDQRILRMLGLGA